MKIQGQSLKTNEKQFQSMIKFLDKEKEFRGLSHMKIFSYFSPIKSNQSSFWKQLYLLSQREFRNTIRDRTINRNKQT